VCETAVITMLDGMSTHPAIHRWSGRVFVTAARGCELDELGRQADRRVVVASPEHPRREYEQGGWSAEVQPHQDAREPTRDRVGVGGLSEAGVLEELARAHIGHRQVDLLASVFHGVTLDRRRAL
jgi:hypothetical protein